MATLSASLFISLDGVVEVGEGEWHFPYFNDEMGAAVGVTHAGDTMLFGRVTYDSFAGAWPEREQAGEADAEFAKELGDKRKIVVSHQDLDFQWRNSEQLEGDLIEGVRKLKEEPGRIAMSGSPSVVRQLLRAGLLDELHLFVHPIVAGSGMKLFDGLGQVPLRLVSSQPFSTGVLYLVYGPDLTAPTGSYDEAKEHLTQEA